MSNLALINKKIYRAIMDNSMIRKNDSVIVAVSGGADSMTLLHFLKNLSEAYNLKIIVAHLNHGIRGEEATKDECFVKEYCKKISVQYEIKHCDIINIAKQNAIGLEECGRKERYKFFYELSTTYNAKIATGHTLSDRVETTVFNITRGSGLKGLISILPKRDNIIRPLIYLTRKETEDYCKMNDIAYVTDSSNLSKDYTRNLIRLDIIPKLKEINPRFEESVFRLIKTAEKDNQYIEDQAKEIYKKAFSTQGFNLKLLRSTNDCVLSRVIKLMLNERNLDMNTIEAVKAVINQKIVATNIKGNKKVFIEKDLLKIEAVLPKFKSYNCEQYSFKLGNITTENGKIISTKIISKEEFDKIVKFNKNIFKNALNYDIIKDNMLFRNRLPGDKFKSADNCMSKKVKKLFNEKKIPLSERDKLFLLASGNKIFWIEVLGISSEAIVNEYTKKIILINVEEQ